MEILFACRKTPRLLYGYFKCEYFVMTTGCKMLGLLEVDVSKNISKRSHKLCISVTDGTNKKYYYLKNKDKKYVL